MVVSLLGVGAALAASPLAFQALMWFGVGFWTAFLHPKSLVFYLAFFTQFVDAAKPLALQYVPLIGTAATVAGIVLGGYALISVRLKPHI